MTVAARFKFGAGLVIAMAVAGCIPPDRQGQARPGQGNVLADVAVQEARSQ